MSESAVTTTAEVKRGIAGIREPVVHRRARSRFYVGVSGSLLLVVVFGFTPTLYLRALFDVPRESASVLAHGIVMTAWFVGVFLLSTLVAVRRTDIHRRIGWVVVGFGIAVLFSSAAVTLSLVSRRIALGVDIEARIRNISVIVWSDLAAMLAFAVFFSTAVVLRQRPEIHKRLMVLSTISIVQPAMSRILGWPVFDGLNGTLMGLGGLLLFVLVLGLHDVIARNRVHPVTVLGGSFLMACKIIGIYVIAHSEAGLSFVRGLK